MRAGATRRERLSGLVPGRGRDVPGVVRVGELELRVNCIPVHVAALRPLGARPAAVPVSTRTIILLKAIDVRGRRPILEMPFHVQLQPKPKRRPPDAAVPPPPAAEDDDADGAAPVTAAPAPATPGSMFPAELAAVNGFELLPPVPGSRATMRFMGHGVYEIEMLTDAMGAFELVVTSPTALPTPLLVYARMPLTATPGATHPASCRLHVGLVDVGPDGTLHTVAGNSLPLSVDVFDHVANVVDGRDGSWTYQCDGLAALESIAATTFTESIFWADPPTGVARKPFNPHDPFRLKLTAAGIYELAVKFTGPVNEQIVPAAGVAQPDASDAPLDPKTNLPMSTARPVRLVVSPSALSAVHCTVRGSGLHSRWKDQPELEEREILFLARDHYGNPLGRSPPARLGPCGNAILTCLSHVPFSPVRPLPPSGHRLCVVGKAASSATDPPDVASPVREWRAGRLDGSSDEGGDDGDDGDDILGPCAARREGEVIKGNDGVSRYKMTDETAALLHRYFLPFNQKLFDLLGRRLPWGEPL